MCVLPLLLIGACATTSPGPAPDAGADSGTSAPAPTDPGPVDPGTAPPGSTSYPPCWDPAPVSGADWWTATADADTACYDVLQYADDCPASLELVQSDGFTGRSYTFDHAGQLVAVAWFTDSVEFDDFCVDEHGALIQSAPLGRGLRVSCASVASSQSAGCIGSSSPFPFPSPTALCVDDLAHASAAPTPLATALASPSCFGVGQYDDSAGSSFTVVVDPGRWGFQFRVTTIYAGLLDPPIAVFDPSQVRAQCEAGTWFGPTQPESYSTPITASAGCTLPEP